MEPVLSYGDYAAPMPMRITRGATRGGLETATVVFHCRGPQTLKKGSTPPGVPGMTVDSWSRDDEDGSDYDLTLNCSGASIESATQQLEGFPRKMTQLNGLDGFEDAWITTNRDLFTEGKTTALMGAQYGICTASHADTLKPGFFRVHGTFAALFSFKSYERTIQTNGQQIGGEIIWNFPEGWSNTRKGSVSLPKLIVTDTYRTLTPPVTNDIPGTADPPNAPRVKLVSLTGTDLTHYWPPNWGKVGLASSNVGAIHQFSITYEFQFPVTP